MGRFDQLTQLEEKSPRAEKTSVPESTQVVKPTSTLVHKYTNPQVYKPTSIQTHKYTNPQVYKPTSGALPQSINEKPQKYTTHLQPEMVKRIKIFAVQQDIKDYEVVEKALTEYFERNK